MKKTFLSFFILVGLISLPFLVSAFTIPAKPNSYVLDTANLLDAGSKASLEQNLNQFEKEEGNEIVVVTIPSLEGDTIENVAQEIFTAWGIGKKEQNNGALLLVSRDDHKMRIHVGYGLEPTLTDITAYHIEQEQIVPAFKDGNYALGIINGVNAIESVIRDPANALQYQKTNKSKSSGFDPMYIIVFVIFALQWCAAILGKSKSWWAGGVLGGAIGIINLLFHFVTAVFFINAIIFVGMVGFGLLFDYFVSRSYAKSKALGTVMPWWFGGGGGRGGSGGGFGGFGGGFSGGGGSSSSW